MTSAHQRAMYNFARHYSDLLARIDEEIQKGQHTAAAATFDTEWPQIQRAHEIALNYQLDDGNLALLFFLDGARIRERRRPLHELEQGGAAALRTARRQGNVVRASVHLNLAKAIVWTPRLERARMHAQAAIRLLLTTTPSDGRFLFREKALAEAYGSLATILNYLGRSEDARKANLDALLTAERVDYDHGQAMALGNLGTIDATTGRLDSALNCFRRATIIARRSGDLYHVALWLANTAQVLVELDRVDEAAKVAEEGLEPARRLNHRQKLAHLYAVLSQIALRKNNVTEASDWCTQSRAIAEEIGDPLTMSNALMIQANIDELLGLTNADATFAEASDILTNANRTGYASRTHDAIATFKQSRNSMNRLITVTGRFAVARQAHDSISAFESLREDPDIRESPALLARTQMELACALAHKGNWDAAIAHYDESLRTDPQYEIDCTSGYSELDALAKKVSAYDSAADRFRQHRARPENLGLTLAAIGRLASGPLLAFRTARAVLSEAIDLLSRAGFGHLKPLEEDLATADHNLHATAQSLGVPLESAMSKSAVDDQLKTLHQVRSVNVDLLDGKILIGSPLHVIVGELSLLTIVDPADRAIVVPLDWLAPDR